MQEHLGSTSTPFTIGDGDSETGARLGGTAPQGIKPGTPTLRYFLTVPIIGWSKDDCANRFLSVFTDTSDDFVFGGRAARVFTGGGVEVVFHEHASRSGSSNPWDSNLTPHPILLGRPEVDMQKEGDHLRPSAANKLGGMPYLVQRGGALEREVANLLSAGYRQCLQIDFPSATDAAVSGDWPFGSAMFHVLVRTNSGKCEWQCFWEK